MNKYIIFVSGTQMDPMESNIIRIINQNSGKIEVKVIFLLNEISGLFTEAENKGKE